jgi:hypothetical protein
MGEKICFREERNTFSGGEAEMLQGRDQCLREGKGVLGGGTDVVDGEAF